MRGRFCTRSAGAADGFMAPRCKKWSICIIKLNNNSNPTLSRTNKPVETPWRATEYDL